LGVHVAYYTLVIGGDHFEYRVYSHLVPLLWTSTLALGVWAAPRPRETFLIMVACLGLALPIPWVHFARTQHLHSRAETFQLQVSVADAMPWPLGPVAEVWDEWQGWLIGHFVCMRHQEHKAFVQHQLGKYPSRWEGLEMSWDRRVVLVDRTVGVPGWNLPNIAIIDAHGLNDYVIARTPVTQRRERRMAHDRTAPKGYLGCLKPNARVRHGMLLVSERPLRDDEVVWCESAFLPPPLLNTPNDQK
jgi:arabinofuranosyltransferase